MAKARAGYMPPEADAAARSPGDQHGTLLTANGCFFVDTLHGNFV